MLILAAFVDALKFEDSFERRGRKGFAESAEEIQKIQKIKPESIYFWFYFVFSFFVSSANPLQPLRSKMY
jgi:hypothetical protein